MIIADAASAAAVAPRLPDPEKLAAYGLRIAIALLIAFVILRLLYLVVGRFEKFVVRVGDGSTHALQRAETLAQILRGVAGVLVAVGVLIHVLAVFGWNVMPILAGAGVLGLALGFGAQTLVRDTIAGVFILSEDQFAIGDLIEVNGKPATVEAMNLRFTRLRDFNGFVHFVPNGEMKIVTNRSRGWQRVAVDVPIASDQDVDKALEICRRVVDAMNAEEAWRSRLMDPIELWGLESLTSAEATFRIVIRARPGPDAPEASRALRQRVHKALAEGGIRFGPSREISLTPAGTATAVPATG